MGNKGREAKDDSTYLPKATEDRLIGLVDREELGQLLLFMCKCVYMLG